MSLARSSEKVLRDSCDVDEASCGQVLEDFDAGGALSPFPVDGAKGSPFLEGVRTPAVSKWIGGSRMGALVIHAFGGRHAPSSGRFMTGTWTGFRRPGRGRSTFGRAWGRGTALGRRGGLGRVFLMLGVFRAHGSEIAWKVL